MRQFFPVEDLARDERFVQTNMAERMQDARQPRLRDAPASGTRSSAKSRAATARLTPDRPDASDAARSLMHGIMTGEIQALEGAGRTAHDFATGDGTNDTIPFELKLDMARQAWDEARHVEISVKLSDWMGTELGQFAENTVLFQAACSNDPILRLAGVNRALEGLAIDVFTQMKEFGDIAGDPYLEFCEDWMLADEVTHVKMGSDWLRRVTEKDPERRAKALEFQQVVDKLFSFGGARGESDESSIGLARRFRELAGFTDDEVDVIAKMDADALAERTAAVQLAQEAAGAVAAFFERHLAMTTGTDRSKVTVAPTEFKLVKYDPDEIASVTADLADRIGLANPIRIVVDETTPMAGMASTLDGTSSDALITIHVESGALEDTKQFTNFNRHHAEVSLGRMLVRAHDRLRPDFAGAPDDDSLSLRQEAAWNTNVNGRLERLGVEVNRQRWLYNHRNRFGFTDDVDADFDRLWSSDDLSWSAIDPDA